MTRVTAAAFRIGQHSLSAERSCFSRKERITIMTERRELTEIELNEVSGGNFFLGLLAGVLGNEISTVINSDGPRKGGILDFFMKNVVPH